MDRYKVRKMEEKLADNDLDRFKDFQTILGSYKRKLWLTKIIWTGAAASAVAAVALSLIYFSPSSEKATVDNFLESEHAVKANLEPNSYNNNFEYLDTMRIDLVATDHIIRVPKPKAQQTLETLDQIETISFAKAFPSYSLDSAIREGQKLISLENAEKISGAVTVVVLIDESGSVKEPKVIAGISRDIDLRIIEIINNLPAWNPAILNNKPIASTVTIPVEVSINQVR